MLKLLSSIKTRRSFRLYIKPWKISIMKYLICFVVVLSFLFGCDDNVRNSSEREKILTGYHLIGSDSLALNEEIEALRVRFGEFKCSTPEDLCIVHDTIVIHGVLTPIVIHIGNHSGAVGYVSIDIPVKDTLAFSEFTNWKEWKKDGVWNTHEDEYCLIQYYYKSQGDSVVFKYGAEVKGREQ